MLNMSRHNKHGDNVQAHSLRHFVTKRPSTAPCCAMLHVGCISKTLPGPQISGNKAACMGSSLTMLLTIEAQGLAVVPSHHTVHPCAGSDKKCIKHTWPVGVAF